MMEQDYLMRLLMQFFQAMARSWSQAKEHEDPIGAAESLEDAISNATDIDGSILLSLAPESISSVMRVSGVDPDVTQFVARSMLLESVYLQQAGNYELARVRTAQAHAIAREYGFSLPDDPSDFQTITEGLEEAAAAGGFNEGNSELDDFDEFGDFDDGGDTLDDLASVFGISLK